MGIKGLTSKAGLFLRKHSPEILGAVGMVATVAGVIWACKSTVDSADDIRECQADVAQLKNDIEEEIVDKKAGKKEIWKARVLCAKKVSVKYVGPVVLVSTGLFCQYKSRSILNGRLNSLAAAYTALEARYKLLEDNVRRDYGEDELNRLKYGLRSQKGIVRVPDDVGNDREEEVTIAGVLDEDFDELNVIFDNRSGMHLNSAVHCKNFIKTTEDTLTELLPQKEVIWFDWAMDRFDIHPKDQKEARLWHSICWKYDPKKTLNDQRISMRAYQIIDPDDAKFDLDYNPSFRFDPNFNCNFVKEWYTPKR